MYLFTPLDILTVALTNDSGKQFSSCAAPVYVSIYSGNKYPQSFLDKFENLRVKMFDGTVVARRTKQDISFSLFEIWGSMKNYGLADVDLCKENGQNMLKVGKVVFPFDSLVEYVEEAKQLLKDAKF